MANTERPMPEIENQFVVIPLVDYTELRETAVRYALLAEHIESVIRRGEEGFPGYNTGLFKAVVGWEEKEKGEEVGETGKDHND